MVDGFLVSGWKFFKTLLDVCHLAIVGLLVASDLWIVAVTVSVIVISWNLVLVAEMLDKKWCDN